MVAMRYVKCQLPVCIKPCVMYGCLSILLFVFPPSSLPPSSLSPSPFPSLPPLFPLSLPLSLLSPSSLPPLSLFPFSLPLSLPLSSLPPPPLQGDEPLNSDDDDEDSDGEGAHFDTEDNIVCQFEKVRCSPGYCGDQHPSHCAALCHPWVLS